MILNSPYITGSLTVTGNANILGALTVTGSLAGTATSASYAYTASSAINAFSASKAISSSYADTASYANTFTVGSTLTAQTLVVQTITSSINYITGSTRFGSLLGNTHTFTGSLNITGSSHVIFGNVGIGSTSPTNRLEVIGISGSSGIITPLYVNGWNATTNVGGTNTSYGGIHLSNALDTTAVLRLLGSGHIQLATDSPGRFISFATDNFAERVRIVSGGSVGIGTTSPSSLLDVRGVLSVGGANNTYSVIQRSIAPAGSQGMILTAGTGKSEGGSGITFADNSSSGGTIWLSGNSSDIYGGGVYFYAYGQTDSANVIGFNTRNGAGTVAERMRISSTGVVTRPYQPLSMGAMPGDQYVASATFTTISFQTNYGFYQANVGSSWNNSSNYFTAPVAGTYLLNASLYTSSVGQIAAFINGNRTTSMVANGATLPTTWHGTLIITLNAGDVLTLKGYGDSGGYIYQNLYHSWFAIYLL